LRIEDTDTERSKKEYEQDILDSLTWLGLTHDEIFRQSERTNIYKKHLKSLIDKGFAYISKEEPKEEGQRSEVIRFKNPNKKITFTDLIRGEITFDTADLKDFVIAKSLEEPLYHLAVVVDDFEMGITHIIRGEDHISNTPRQILLLEALGAPRPLYAHIPLILDAQKAKLSKRKHGEMVSLAYYRNRGYTPEAIINFMALLGWNPGTKEEIFSLDELIKFFDLSKVQKGGAIFNIEKLNWIQKEYIRRLPEEIVKNKVSEVFVGISAECLKSLVPVIRERITTLSDIETLKNGEFDFVQKKPDIKTDMLLWKESNKEKTVHHLEEVIKLLENISAWTSEEIKKVVFPYADKEGRGEVLWPFRFSLSGKEKSPDPFTLSAILGKDETLGRIKAAILKLNQ